MARVFGPIQGPGVKVTERDADQPITPASLGWAAYAGKLERGPVGELIWLFGKGDMAKIGGRIEGSDLPDNVEHFFNTSGGAGGLVLVRITDGNELQAAAPLYARRATQTQIGTVKAKDGGRWGGFASRATGDADTALDFTETELDTGVSTWAVDQWKGAYLELAGVANSRYEVIGNDADGVLTVAADSTMVTDLDGGSDGRWYLVLEGNTNRELGVMIGDGDTDPENQFSVDVYLAGARVRGWTDLSMDPANARYWVDVINEDAGNYYITVEDTWQGARPANVRPANVWGVASDLTATVLTATVHEFAVDSDAGGNPTFVLGAVTDAHDPQTVTVTMTSATVGDAVSDKYGPIGEVTLGAAFTPDVKWAPGFTVTAGGTALETGDELTITFKPLAKSNELIGGRLVPDKLDNGDKSYRIIANTATTITVAVGSDMATDVAGGSDEFMVIAPRRLYDGRDGHASVVDNDYIEAYDVDNSLFKQINGQGLGLVKFAAPGVTATAVQKAGAAFVDSGVVGPQQWRFEVPANLTTEQAIENHVNNVLGRSPWGDHVVTAQSSAYINDPDAPGRLKLVSMTGMIHGREASIAAAARGYHKAAAGVSATLPLIVKLTTGERRLNEEFLTPRGINVIRKQGGNFILWGDRSVTSNTAWKFKHTREVMSYVINQLRESFDFSVFEINDPIQWAVVRASLISFFKPMYQARALDNALPFGDACVIKIDAENNTQATADAGDLNVEVTLAIVGTIERISFLIGKAGIIPSAA